MRMLHIRDMHPLHRRRSAHCIRTVPTWYCTVVRRKNLTPITVWYCLPYMRYMHHLAATCHYLQLPLLQAVTIGPPPSLAARPGKRPGHDSQVDLPAFLERETAVSACADPAYILKVGTHSCGTAPLQLQALRDPSKIHPIGENFPLREQHRLPFDLTRFPKRSSDPVTTVRAPTAFTAHASRGEINRDSLLPVSPDTVPAYPFLWGHARRDFLLHRPT